MLFVLRYYLNLSIVVVQELSKEKGGTGLIPRRGRTLKKANADFHADTVLTSPGGSYLVQSFSQKHRWMRSKIADEPRLDICVSDIRDIAGQWLQGDFIRTLPRPDNFLLGEASAAFNRSNNNYLFTLGHIRSRRAAILAAGDSADYFEAASTFESFIGNYRTARLLRDSLEDVFGRSRSAQSPYKILGDARQAIYDSARRHSVVIVNEAHTQPLHRRLISSLLDSLCALGYRHLFAETLVPDDSEMAARGFPVQASGYYSSEPHFGAMLRKALRLGYMLHSYDNDSSGTEREMGQAAVVADFIKKHPAEKVLVHCGHGHGNENPADSMMGFFLQQMSGVDPFTIEQTRLTEHGDTLHEHPIYPELPAGSALDAWPASIQFLQKDGAPVRSYDAWVALPRSEYSANGFPRWHFELGGDTTFSLTLHGEKYRGALLQIFDARETKTHHFKDLIPLVNVQLADRNGLDFRLAHGKYVVYATDMRRRILFEKRLEL